MPVNYMDLFRYRVTAAIERIAPECPSCQILMVPHTDDAHHQSTYPQPKFNMQELFPEFMYDADERAQFMKSVKLLPNPCVVSVNEIKIGINAADIMRHMLPEDVHRVPTAPGAAKPPRTPFSARLPAHIWEQNSFYPLYPAGKQVALDLRRADQLTSQLRTMTPDVMILASKLNHFANDCKGVLCVNPGRLTKGVSAGTYARVVLQPFSEEALDQQGGNLDAQLEHDCLKRASVSILRI
jgi:DNA polymerase alpha subunit B